MATIKQMQYLISQLRQKRYYVEQKVANVGLMLSACMILRYRQRHSRSYESIKKIKKEAEVKSYAYLTFIEAGKVRHLYVPKENIGETAKLTEAYKRYRWQMKQIRQLNKRIVDVLENIARKQTKEVKDCGFKNQSRLRRDGTAKPTK